MSNQCQALPALLTQFAYMMSASAFPPFPPLPFPSTFPAFRISQQHKQQQLEFLSGNCQRYLHIKHGKAGGECQLYFSLLTLYNTETNRRISETFVKAILQGLPASFA